MIIYDLLEKSLDVFVQLHQSNLYTKNSRQRVQHTKIVFCMQVPAKFYLDFFVVYNVDMNGEESCGCLQSLIIPCPADVWEFMKEMLWGKLRNPVSTLLNIMLAISINNTHSSSVWLETCWHEPTPGWTLPENVQCLAAAPVHMLQPE